LTFEIDTGKDSAVRAFISDIHGNIEALCAVLKDIEQHDVEEILCLGDIVGYGPDPEACIDLVMEKAKITLMGNHDHALIHKPLGFNPIAAEVIYLTKEIMDPQKHPEKKETDIFEPHFYTCGHEGETPQCLLMEHAKDARWKFIENLPDRHQESRLLCVHATPLDPIFEYLLPDRFVSGWKPERVAQQFGAFEGLAFYGHTHLPCVIADDLTCKYPSDIECRFEFERSKKYIVNIGSVGQPRDGDNRACYLLLDDAARTIEWRRVPYDVQTTVRKSDKMCGEGNWCGARLLVGR
jgi:diadenosine tetraphosphatase ApaH/serine/threonine PP2A family protein phosphatase